MNQDDECTEHPDAVPYGNQGLWRCPSCDLVFDNRKPDYMRTSMTQEDWDEFSRALDDFIAEVNEGKFGPPGPAARTFYAVMVKYQDDLPMTSDQRYQVRDLRGRPNWRQK